MKYGYIIKAVVAAGLGIAGPAHGQSLEQQDTIVLARPRVGLLVDVRARETDSIGAFVEKVNPGSPAAKAGLKPADIITKLNGKLVASFGAEPSGSRLVGFVLRSEPKEPMRFEVRRGTKTQKVVITFSSKPSPVAALKTVSLNPQLGRYFGTAKGLLVLEGIDDDRLPLQGGDVILRVDGRTALHPIQLKQRLRKADDPVKLNVIRRRRRIVVTFQP